MSGWTERKHVGDLHEQRVAEELTVRGWHVNPWGQGVLTAPVRAALRATDSALRWTPDLVAARGEDLTLVDCKGRASSSATGRHAVERAAVRAHLQLTAWIDLPIYYVFDDLTVLTAHDVLTAGRVGPHTRIGSGAPYYLIDGGLADPFDSVFGRQVPPARALRAVA